MKRILVACGNGIATSTVVASKIREYLGEKGIQVETSQCKLMEIPGKIQNFDLVVTSGQYDGESYNVPIVKGLALLTGIGAEETLEKIYDALSQ